MYVFKHLLFELLLNVMRLQFHSSDPCGPIVTKLKQVNSNSVIDEVTLHYGPGALQFI